jgi:uncharacterized membrane protein
MKIMAGIVALISLVLMILNWHTTLAVAWGVAFAGWIPHVFGDDQKEAGHGEQA